MWEIFSRTRQAEGSSGDASLQRTVGEAAPRDVEGIRTGSTSAGARVAQLQHSETGQVHSPLSANQKVYQALRHATVNFKDVTLTSRLSCNLDHASRTESLAASSDFEAGEALQQEEETQVQVRTQAAERCAQPAESTNKSTPSLCVSICAEKPAGHHPGAWHAVGWMGLLLCPYSPDAQPQSCPAFGLHAGWAAWEGQNVFVGSTDPRC